VDSVPAHLTSSYEKLVGTGPNEEQHEELVAPLGNPSWRHTTFALKY